jgi:predicted amidohydrolase
MEDTRIGLAQMQPKLGDLDANLKLHRDWIRRAAADGCRLVVFPELSLTGYLLRDIVPDVAVTLKHPAILELAAASKGIDLVFGFVEDGPGYRFFNVGAYFSGGELVHLHRKIHLPTYGLFQEGREFARGEQLRAFDAAWGRAGLLVCEDLWHQTCAWLLAQEGAEVIFGISNGPTRGAKPGREITSLGVWQELLTVTAQFLTSYMVYVNRVGFEDGLSFGGGSMVVDPFGRVVSRLAALDEELGIVELEAEVIRRARTAYPLIRDGNLELVRRELGRICRQRFGLEEDEPAADTGRASRSPATSRVD